MKKTIGIGFLVLLSAAAARSQASNPLAKAAENDWAKYIVNSRDATLPDLSVENQERWRVVSVVLAAGVRIDNYSMIAGQRTRLGGSARYFNNPFEPVFELGGEAKIEIVSTSPESLSVKGVAYACTKIVRKVGSPDWNGTSPVWLCPQIPVGGVVKIENRCRVQLLPDQPPHEITEIWVLADFGFKNWKD